MNLRGIDLLASGLRWSLLAAVIFTCDRAEAQDDFVDLELTVKSIDQAQIPARETGVLAELFAKQGDSVTRKQIVGALDDSQAELEQRLADAQHEITKKRAENFTAADLAEKDLAQQKELSVQQALLSDIAAEKASNRIRVLAALKSQAVAKNELARATNARREFVDAVSKSQIDGLNLAYERSQLEAQQAEFERKIDLMTAESEKSATKIQSLGVEKSEISLRQSTTDRTVLQLQATAGELTSELAKLTVQRHKIVSTIDGVVAETYRSVGEWVREGEPIMRVVRLDRLRAEGFIPSRLIPLLRKSKSVELQLQQRGETIRRSGSVSFISPEVDPVGQEVLFWVEFDNHEQDVLPGMRMTIVSTKQ